MEPDCKDRVSAPHDLAVRLARTDSERKEGAQGKCFSMDRFVIEQRRRLADRLVLSRSLEPMNPRHFPELHASPGRLAPIAGHLVSPSTGIGLASLVFGPGTRPAHHLRAA